MIRRRVRAYGRVQGVFFRDTCRREALAHGVTGWVRNLPDGSVQAVFQGEPDAVAHMVAWARRGPHRALVTRLDVADERPVTGPEPVAEGEHAALPGFDIRPGPRAWVP